jgi:hypothetical protein
MTENVWRWFDHKGRIVSAPATTGRPTAYRWDDNWTHWMFGTPSSEATFQALTLCGKRALEVPGRGQVTCPECLALGVDEAREIVARRFQDERGVDPGIAAERILSDLAEAGHLPGAYGRARENEGESAAKPPAEGGIKDV